MKSNRWQGAVLLAVFGVVAVLVFHALWAPGAVLLTTDDNVGLLRNNQRMLENSVVHPWMGEALWGMSTMSIVRPGYFLLKAVRAETFMNTYHAACLALSAWLLAMYLRDKGLRLAACAFGGLVAFWTGTNLTLTYAGHVGKYGTMVFLSLAVFALGRWGKTGRAAWGVAAGAAAGAMFLEQADVALFCALLLVPLGLFEAWFAAGGLKTFPSSPESWGAMAATAFASALAALLLAGGAALAAKGSGVEDVPGGENAEAKWSYLTQWSQPPDESLDLIAPGWMGWRSFYEKGPYWGRLGRGDGWNPQMGPNGMNHRGESVYVGILPLLFALLGLAAAVRRWRVEGRTSAAIFVWGGLCVAALLLSFGKYFVLYRPLTWLPGFGSIRNPNKFMHFFQMAWGVVAAFGLDAAMRTEARAARKWIWGAGIAAGVFLLSGAALWADLESGAARLAASWGPEWGRAIQWNKAFSITYAGLALAIGAVLVWWLPAPVFHGVEKNLPRRGKKDADFPQRGKKFSTAWKTSWAAWLPAAAVAFEAAVLLAPHYLQTMPPRLVAENDLVRYLKSEVGHSRTAMAGQDGFYGQWLTYLFPYQGIPSVNVTQLPRPPPDYVAFWDAVRDPVRTWQLAAVSHVLAHGLVAQQLLANPAWAAQMEPVWAYQPFDDGQGGVGTRRVPTSLTAPEVVLKMKKVPPRVAAVASWRTAEDDEALRTLADPAFEPYASVLLAPDSEVPAPPAEPGPPAEIDVEILIPGRYVFTVKNSGPVVVRVAEKYDSNWKATVDGDPRPVLRVDYMFQGVALDRAGTHRVEMVYRPSSVPVALQWAGILCGLGAAVALAVPRRKAAAA